MSGTPKPVAEATAAGWIREGSFADDGCGGERYPLRRGADGLYAAFEMHEHEWGYVLDSKGTSISATCSICSRSRGTVTLSGTWSFGTPYTTVTGRGADCRAADALLQFASSLEAGETIRSMTAGYRMQMDSSRRLQLIPTWKIVTDRTDYFMDCDKKTLVTL